jgi:HB1, ASXL, restriction endonuclease HTH domain
MLSVSIILAPRRRGAEESALPAGSDQGGISFIPHRRALFLRCSPGVFAHRPGHLGYGFLPVAVQLDAPTMTSPLSAVARRRRSDIEIVADRCCRRPHQPIKKDAMSATSTKQSKAKQSTSRQQGPREGSVAWAMIQVLDGKRKPMKPVEILEEIQKRGLAKKLAGKTPRRVSPRVWRSVSVYFERPEKGKYQLKKGVTTKSLANTSDSKSASKATARRSGTGSKTGRHGKPTPRAADRTPLRRRLRLRRRPPSRSQRGPLRRHRCSSKPKTPSRLLQRCPKRAALSSWISFDRTIGSRCAPARDSDGRQAVCNRYSAGQTARPARLSRCACHHVSAASVARDG